MSNDQQSGKKQRKMRNVIINASFQSKVIVLVAGIVFLQAITVSGYIFFMMSDFMNKVVPAISTHGELLDAIEIFMKEVLIGVGTAHVEFFIFAFILSIYFSHKLAGPNYAIKRAINNLLDGVEHHKINLRKGDEFHDLADRINTLFSDYHLVPKEDDAEEVVQEDNDL